MTRTAFEASKNLAEQEAAAAARRNRMVSEGCDVSKNPLLQVCRLLPGFLPITQGIWSIRKPASDTLALDT